LGSAEDDLTLGLSLLMNWNCHLTIDTIGGTVYEVLMWILNRKIVEAGVNSGLKSQERLRSEADARAAKVLAEQVMGASFNQLLKGKSALGNFLQAVVMQILSSELDSNGDASLRWWALQSGGSKRVIEESIRATVQWLRINMGPRTSEWKWGQLHRVSFSHMLSKKLGFAPFSRGALSYGW